MKNLKYAGIILVTAFLGSSFLVSEVFASENSPQDILRSGLLGAGVGAISADASGGKAGKGALIGAGVSVIGGVLLDFLTGGPSQNQQAVYAQPSYAVSQASPVYYSQPAQNVRPVRRPKRVYRPQAVSQPVYVQQAPVYQPAQMDTHKQILKQGLLGAGVGAIAADASGGKAGTGALIGAGTNIIGGVLLDMLTGSSAQNVQPVYQASQSAYASAYYQNYQANTNVTPNRRIIQKYDAYGNMVSQEEVYE